MGDTRLHPVGLVADHAQIGGGETSLIDLAGALAASDRFRPFVACREEGPLVERLADLGLACEILPYPARFRAAGVAPVVSPSAFRRFRDWLRRRRIEVVHANGPFALFYGGLAARAEDRPVAFTSHLASDAGSLLKRWLGRRVADRILTVSPAIARRWREVGVAASRIHTIPLGVDVSKYELDEAARRRARASLGWSDEGLVVCAVVGRVHRVKGQRRFLDALAALAPKHPALRGVVCGSVWFADEDARRYDAEIEERLSRPPLAAVARRLPRTDDLRSLLSTVDILVIPSDSESFGRIGLEAMACGRPVVSTPCGGPETYIVDGDTGAVADDISAEALARAMAPLIERPGLREEMGARGRRRVERDFSLSAQVERTVAVYRELLSSAEAASPTRA